jgi:hypothetical protein
MTTELKRDVDDEAQPSPQRGLLRALNILDELPESFPDDLVDRPPQMCEGP